MTDPLPCQTVKDAAQGPGRSVRDYAETCGCGDCTDWLEEASR